MWCCPATSRCARPCATPTSWIIFQRRPKSWPSPNGGAPTVAWRPSTYSGPGNRDRSAFERFLQLAGEFVGRGLHRALHDLGGAGHRLVERFFDGWLAHRDELCLVHGELLGRVAQLLTGQRPAPEPLRDDPVVRAVYPLDDLRLAVLLLVDHGRVVLADRFVLVQLLNGVQIRQRAVDILIR